MTLQPQNLTVFLVHFALNLSPIRHFTMFFPSIPNKLNLLSSLKNTFAQFSYVQITYLFAKLYSLILRTNKWFLPWGSIKQPYFLQSSRNICLHTLTHEVLFITLSAFHSCYFKQILGFKILSLSFGRCCKYELLLLEEINGFEG